MANILIYCDGTWNTTENMDKDRPAPTNVRKMFASLSTTDANGVYQKKYYGKGVGTTGWKVKRLVEGGLGKGIEIDIQNAYRALGDLYEEGDKVFIIGFSRGAFTARSLTGMIAVSGLAAFHGGAISDRKKRQVTKYAFNYFHRKKNKAMLAETLMYKSVDVEFLGVFDTVGALGVPSEFNYLLPKFMSGTRYRFPDTDLGATIKHARHAIAIDERRRTFSPTLWTKWKKSQDVVQMWFPGVHGDIGGGYAENGLSDFPLAWMIGEARKRGLAFEDNFVNQINGNSQGFLHQSATSIFQRLRLRPRAVPHFNESEHGASVSPAARNRQQNPPINQPSYWQTKTLKPGEQHTVLVNAKSRWHPTGLYLKTGQSYSFHATGKWLDATIETGPEGSSSTFKHFNPLIALLTGAFQFVANMTWGNGPKGFFPFTRRQPTMPWFALVGCIANGQGVNPVDHKLAEHEHFEIGEGHPDDRRKDHKPNADGFLYCYANEVWRMYRNNKGTVRLTITNTTPEN